MLLQAFVYFRRIAKKNHEHFGGLPCYFTKLVLMFFKTVSYSEIVLGYISFICFSLVLLYTLSPICPQKKTLKI